MAKYEFESIDEILEHPAVLKAIDKIETEKEQELYDLETSMKDALIKLLINQGIQTDAFQFRKLTKTIHTGNDELIKSEYETLVDKLKSRSIDSLKDMIDDISDVFIDMVVSEDSKDSPISKLTKAINKDVKVMSDNSDNGNESSNENKEKEDNNKDDNKFDSNDIDENLNDNEINNPSSSSDVNEDENDSDSNDDEYNEDILSTISEISRNVKK